MKTIKELVKDNFVTFSRYKKGIFYYRLLTNEESLEFPVPLEDIGDGTMLYIDKAIAFMRWIRIAQKEGTLIPQTIEF